MTLLEAQNNLESLVLKVAEAEDRIIMLEEDLEMAHTELKVLYHKLLEAREERDGKRSGAV